MATAENDREFSVAELNAIEANKRIDAATMEAIMERAYQLGKLPETAVYSRVGAWSKIKFEEKPSEETRRFLRLLGFFWNARRGWWNHKHGVPYRGGHAPYDPRLKYGELILSNIELLERVR